MRSYIRTLSGGRCAASSSSSSSFSAPFSAPPRPAWAGVRVATSSFWSLSTTSFPSTTCFDSSRMFWLSGAICAFRIFSSSTRESEEEAAAAEEEEEAAGAHAADEVLRESYKYDEISGCRVGAGAAAALPSVMQSHRFKYCEYRVQ